MAKAKRRVGKKKAAKPVARRKPAAKRKPAAAPAAARPVAIPGAWPFPMGAKT